MLSLEEMLQNHLMKSLIVLATQVKGEKTQQNIFKHIEAESEALTKFSIQLVRQHDGTGTERSN